MAPFCSISQGSNERANTKEITTHSCHDQFKSSDGWFNHWKKRHDLHYTKLYNEASEADEEAAAMWTNKNMPELLKKYEPSDI